MKRTLQTLAFAACISVAATSMAQPSGGGRGGQGAPGGPGAQSGGPIQHLLDTFSDIDTNNDGMLSRAELQAAMSDQRPGGRGRPGCQRGPERGPGGPPPREFEQQSGPAGPEGRGGHGGPEGQRGPEERRGPGGPGGPEGRRAPGGERGVPPRPGVVLPDFIVQSLGLSDEQKDKLAALQKEVDTELAAILTDEQKQEMENHQPPAHGPGHGPGHGEGGREGGNLDRPQRPQRPQ